MRGPFDGVDVDLSYDQKTWIPGGFDNRSPCEDLLPNRTPGTPETRYSRLRFRYKGEPFGQYSAVAQVVAAGEASTAPWSDGPSAGNANGRFRMLRRPFYLH